MNKKLIILLFIIPCFFLYSLGNSQRINTVTHSDTTKYQQRIISLAPNITQIICALESQDMLVGKTEYCNYSKLPEHIANIGKPWHPDVEKIISLHPTIVIASSLTDPNSLKTLEKAGLNVAVINNEETIEGTYKTIIDAGTLIDKKSKAEILSDKIQNKIEQIRGETAKITNKKTAVYLMNWSSEPLYAATGSTFINDILESAGLINVAKQSTLWTISKELLISQNPDYIFVPEYSGVQPDISQLKKTISYSTLTSEIIVIDGDSIERQGIDTAQITEQIAKIAYPELFTGK